MTRAADWIGMHFSARLGAALYKVLDRRLSVPASLAGRPSGVPPLRLGTFSGADGAIPDRLDRRQCLTDGCCLASAPEPFSTSNRPGTVNPRPAQGNGVSFPFGA